jgi:cyclic pyranopterin phosphate synthase
MFALPGGKGRIGIISALSDHFCEECNRLRVTAEGKFRPCLFSDKEYAVLPLLRKNERSREEIIRFLNEVTAKKPMGYMLLQAIQPCDNAHVCSRMMSTIGG